MPPFYKLIKRLLPYFFATASFLWVIIFLRLHLMHAAKAFSYDFGRQNYSEMAVGDVFSITKRINALSGNLPWICVHVKKGERNFYARERGDCTTGLWREHVSIEGEGTDSIRVDFTLALQSELALGAVIFAFLQSIVLFLLYDSARRLERERHFAIINLGNFAVQVAHDIRSPLSALRTIVADVESMDEPSRNLLKSATHRINLIAESLLTEHRSISQFKIQAAVDSAKGASIEVVPLLRMLLEEKRAEFRDIKDLVLLLNCAEQSPLVPIPSLAFLRVMSNLLNNSIESIDGSGRVEVTVRVEVPFMFIEVLDNGRGIPEGLIDRLGKEKISVNKKNGNGLGLSFVFDQVKSWGGSVEIQSRLNMGTKIKISLQISG